MKTTKEMIEIMQAFVDGKEIQYFYEGCWDTTPNPVWDWDTFDYRINPQSKKRPMTFDEIVDYWKKHRTEIFTVLFSDMQPTEGYISGIDYENEFIIINSMVYTVDEFIDRARKEDGSKFEVEE